MSDEFSLVDLSEGFGIKHKSGLMCLTHENDKDSANMLVQILNKKYLKESKGNSMENIQRQRRIGQELLSKLEVLDPCVVIAGGAPRDWYLGKEANDLDIYLSYHPNLTLGSNKRSISKVLGIPEGAIETLGVQFDENVDRDTEYAINPDVRCVYEFEYRGIKVQIINMRTEFVDVAEFCFNICQAWTVDCEHIYVTNDFQYAIDHKIVYKTGHFYAHKGAYVEKMRDRFPDYLFLEEKPKEII